MTSSRAKVEQAENAVLAALGALEPTASRAIERHIDTCGTCTQEFSLARDTIAGLAGLVEVQPSSSLRRSVLATVDEIARPETPDLRVVGSAPSAKQRSSARSSRARRSRPVASAFLLVAAAVVLFVGASIFGGGEADEWSREVALVPVDTSSTVSGAISPDEPAVAFLFNPDTGEGVLTTSQLVLLPDDETYQFWLIDDDGAHPAGNFQPDAQGSGTLAVKGLRAQTLSVAISVEPAGGSDVLTGELIYSADLT